MVKVAVAGGLGNVGKTIVEVLKDDPKHDVIVLSRKASDNAAAPVVAVDYNNVDSLKQVLESNNIEAVISALMVGDEVASQSQINLIKAADKSSTTKKMVLSEWGIPFTAEDVSPLPHLAFRLAAIAEARKTGLQWTRFQTGYFMDYYGLPHIKSYQQMYMPVLDMVNKVAAIPGDGNAPVTFTYTFDVAKFVAAALDLPTWDEEYLIVGDKLSWNEFLKLAEDVRGSKFEVHHDDLDKLKSFQVTELPHHPGVYPFFPKEMLQRFFSVFGLYMATGRFDLPIEKALNQKFPEIKPITAKELLEQAWRGK
ncbi:Pyridoxal-phosphate dependent enzyme [Lasiodiplodia theobromae]|uniref:Pyridoxal-phosphate dependent enzyme n=1 Tax=Lasiodiplodia theobromae TaxID=45133 RepID=UPI0015C3B68B|nr:Pyridoxal-phosphate dependent enzyme [Lasiodiplodia theobromae]KAF4541165.1 Pyridoxal-phosphate dependent enzyme [Lasiodiplodia theobromae]